MRRAGCIFQARGFHGRNQFATGCSSTERLNVAGIYPPITTPFDISTGKISYDKLSQNFQTWNSIPFHGYVVLGSNGEFVTLDTEEKLELLRNVRRFALDKHKILAGLGLQGTEQTIGLCKRVAQDKSADAALVITPSFYKGRMSDAALKTHFLRVADQSPLPVILYSVPANTNVDMGAELVIELSGHPNIVGLKDSGGDITKISRIVAETRTNGFQVLAGSAGFLLPALFMGCVGGICALGNVLGHELCQLFTLFQQNRMREAVELQQKLILPNLLVTGKLGVPGLKTAMDKSHSGLYGGPCRPPLLPLQENELKLLLDGFFKAQFPLQS